MHKRLLHVASILQPAKVACAYCTLHTQMKKNKENQLLTKAIPWELRIRILQDYIIGIFLVFGIW